MTTLDSEWVELGSDVRYSHIVDENGDVIGCVVNHPDLEAPGQRCSGPVFFDVPAARGITRERQRWTVVHLEPLSLTPSVMCNRCGTQGHITVGRWIKARP